jgi:hypothetical protein
MSDPETVDQPEATVVRPRQRTPLRRAGCTVLVVLWFLILLVPCFCLILATQGEITIPQGSAPGQVLRVWLINEADERGLGVSSTSAQQLGDNRLCVESTTRYLLWAGVAQPSVSCECYAREATDQALEVVSVANEACASEAE